MAGLTLHKSNRMEALAKALAQTLRVPLDSPLQPEIVVVQSLGMRRWLSLQLAEQHGICANCEFPFPKTFVDDVFAAFLSRPEKSFFADRSSLAWRVMKILPGLISHCEFAPVTNYISGHSADLKLFQLSEKIASVFDQYIVFRPQMVLGWEKGEGDDWQAILWRELVKGRDGEHQAVQARELSRMFQQESPPTNKSLPQRFSVFGISSLPPFYVQLFGALASQIDVHIYLLDPTDQLWAHIISDAEEDKIRRKLKDPKLDATDLHSEEKNSLLASLGKTGRDFQDLILELEPVETKTYYISPHQDDADSESMEDERYLPLFSWKKSANSTLLETLQNDIFNLSDPAQKRPVSEKDHSIQIHSCHGPMREMEVLQDQLLALFENDPSLLPKDIVVMMPDVKTYAPFIEAVFGCAESPEKRIPFTIADRGLRRENSLADTFLKLLDICRSRFGVSSVLVILESPAVQSAFHLNEAHMETVRNWLEKVGVRWGIDAAHRQKLDLPALEQNTWRAGLRRLLLGYALPGREEKLFAGILPFDDIEGNGAEVLGNFVDFAEKLFNFTVEFEKPRSLLDWQKLFLQLVEDFFSSDEEFESELYVLRTSLASLKNIADVAEFDGEISADVVLAYLKRILDNDESTSGFIMGGVTFCALRPMRSVPFSVVCLVGMNDSSFPRPQRIPGFDKMAEKPQIGDRSNRHEDRYLFLEAILSARKVFYVSYVGQSIRDNAPLPPSVLVSELLDYLERGFKVSKDIHPGSMHDYLVTQHRLQAFSAAYFKNSPQLWSYSAENCAASRAALQQRNFPAAFPGEKLSEPEAEWRTVELDSLAKFFCQPAEFFARRRLGIYLRETKTALAERELIELDALSSYGLRKSLSEKSLGGIQDHEALALLKASGCAPLGNMGDCHLHSLTDEARDFAAAVQAHSVEEPLPELAVQQRIGDWEISGTLRDIYPSHLLRARCAETKPKDILRVWIQHLALNLVRPGSASLFIGLTKEGSAETLRFQPVAGSESVMRRLLELYWLGLQEPLRFFPRTSYEFARRKFQPSDRQTISPIKFAEKEWQGGETPGERDDPYFKLCFAAVENPLNKVWEKLAEEIYAPILEAIRRGKL